MPLVVLTVGVTVACEVKILTLEDVNSVLLIQKSLFYELS